MPRDVAVDGRHVPDYLKIEAEVLLRGGTSIPRTCELTGLSSSVVGRIARSVWPGDAKADSIVIRDYPKGVTLASIAAALFNECGIKVTSTAVQSRAQRLRISRPDDYMRSLRQAGTTGRKKGVANRRPYARCKEIARDAETGGYVGWIEVLACEFDVTFKDIVDADRERDDVAFGVRMRLLRERKRLDREAAPPVAMPKIVDRPIHAVPSERTRDTFVPQTAPNVLPTARADPAAKGRPFRMSVMSGPDPLAEARRRQALEGARGRV